MRTALSTIPNLLVLGFVVLVWTAGQANSQLIQLGEALWPGYALHLRSPQPATPPPAADPATPDADLIGDLLGDGSASTAPAGTGADEDLIGDLLAGEAAAPPPTGSTTGSGADEDLIGDLLAGEAVATPPSTTDGSATGADADLIGDLLAGEDIAAPPAEVAGTEPLVASASTLVIPEETAGVRVFRRVDLGLAWLADLGGSLLGHLLVFVLLVCGATATAARHHISLRPATLRRDDQLAEGLQVVVNLGLAASCVVQYQLQQAAGVEVMHPEMPLLWAAGLVVMALLGGRNLLQPVGAAGGSLSGALLATPLYVIMALIAGTYFLLVEQYPAGPAVYLTKLNEHAQMYFFIGLYVWIGMMLKRTRLVERGFDVLRPWRLPPELLVAVVVAAAALPTAYSGASGIFVIAVGGVIYQELRAAGARRQLALAATAMSGSLGVVLSPCLLVVIVAYLNPVTTDVLYGWGRWVFLLTASLFAAAVLLTRQGSLAFAPAAEAGPESARRLRPLVPYAVLFLAVALAYRWLLDARLDEQSAPMILPVILLGMLALERVQDPARPAVGTQLTDATRESTVHIGALLLLMGLSIAFGGVFERSEIMDLFPSDLGSPWLAMGLLVVVLVVIGMTMDPYGAVILVSVTLSDVAAKNGIDLAHFWMVVLVAFELGYLTPPVALNHLLTRQVVGAEEYQDTTGTFWARNERVLLPLVVMGAALLLVAFVPLALY